MSRTRYFLIVLAHTLLLAAVMVALLIGVFTFVAVKFDYPVGQYPWAFIGLGGFLTGIAGMGLGFEAADGAARAARPRTVLSLPVESSDQPGVYEETYIVAGKDLTSMRTAIHRNGGVVVLSAPVPEGYCMTARWEADLTPCGVDADREPIYSCSDHHKCSPYKFDCEQFDAALWNNPFEHENPHN